MKAENSKPTRYPRLGHCDVEVADAGVSLPDQGDDESLASLFERMEEIRRKILSDYDSAGYDYDGDKAAGSFPIVVGDITEENSSVDKGKNGSVYTSKSNDIFPPTQHGTDTLPQKERPGKGDESSLISATGVSLVDNFNWTEGLDSDPLDNVLDRKEQVVIFKSRIRDLAVIFLLILLLLASTVALTAGIARKNSGQSQPDGASQSDILDKLDDMMPETQPTEVSPTETSPSEDSSPPETTNFDTFPSNAPSSDASSSDQSTSVPSIAPTAFFECKDSKREKVYISRYWEYQKCKWLAAEWRAGIRRSVCRNGFEAFDICPVTCGRCNTTDIEENEDD